MRQFLLFVAVLAVLFAGPARLFAEDTDPPKVSVGECMEYAVEFLSQGEYDNAKAWYDYGLKIHPEDAELTIALQSMRLLSAKETERQPIINAINKQMKLAGMQRPSDRLNKALIYAGYFLHPMGVDGFVIIDKVVYEMQDSPVDVFYVGFIKEPVKVEMRDNIKIKAKNKWTAYVLVRNNSDIDFGRRNEAKLYLDTVSTVPAIEEGAPDEPGRKPTSSANPAATAPPALEKPTKPTHRSSTSATGGTSRTTAGRTTSSTDTPSTTRTASEMRGTTTGTGGDTQNTGETSLNQGNEDVFYEVDLTVGPKEFKRIVLDKPFFMLDDDLKPESYTVSVSWVQDRKDPYVCEAYTGDTPVNPIQVEERPPIKSN